MNQEKLTESINNFRWHYNQNRDGYLSEERQQKVDLHKKFTTVFSKESIQSELFLQQLQDMISSSNVKKDMKWLAGGSFFQFQRFSDLLETHPSNRIMQELFEDLLYSTKSLKGRVNTFKSRIDALYQENSLDDKIQLNLISQFLGLIFPESLYIYKSSEFLQAVDYFGYKPKLTDQSAGGKYAYYYDFAKLVHTAMVEAGIEGIDYIDVQTFIYRDDWYTQMPETEIKKKYEEDVSDGMSESIERLLTLLGKKTPQPPKITRGTYYYRDPNLAALVKKLANGVCDLCVLEAPFLNKVGHPYLECHHIEPRAKGGPDILENVVALCPNCHKKMDILDLSEDRKKLLFIAKNRAESLK